jgi:hypothetical protein
VNSCIIMGEKERYFDNSFPGIHQMPHHIHRAATKTRIDATPNEIERDMDDAHEFVNCVKPTSIVRHRISLSQSPQGNHFFRLELNSVNNVFSVGIKKNGK